MDLLERQMDIAHNVHDVEERIADLKEQHGVEMEVLRYNLTETHATEMARVKAEVMVDLEEKFKQKEQDLELSYQHKEQAMVSAKEHDFVEQLRKVGWIAFGFLYDACNLHLILLW